MSTPRKRNQPGLNYKSPIALRLMPAEREQAELLSKRLGKTKSAFAREAYLAGLQIITALPHAAAANDAACSSGTNCIVGATAFYSQPTGQS